MKKTYDPALRESEQGKRLYYYWKEVHKKPHDTEWDDFPGFYEWAMSSGFEPDSRLRLIDSEQPYSPNNCTWENKPNEKDTISKARAAEWDAVVNRIRKHFGMEPLEGTSYANL